MSTCPHSLCAHLGEGKMRCQRCGAIVPMVVTTLRVNAEDYEQLQRVFTAVRGLMQAKSAVGFNDRLAELSQLVGIEPALRLPGDG